MKLSTYTIGLLLVLLFTGCHKAEDILDHLIDDTEEETYRTHEIFPVHLFIADENGDTPTEAGTLLYENRRMNPIMAPDGHQVTLEEFDAVTGTMTMTCTPQGTRIDMEMEGLIPFGTYTMWAVIFDESGTPPLVAGGTDRQQGLFVASPAGKATYSAVVSEGKMSEFGTATDCLLDEPQVRIFGAYHIDGRTYGGSPGPAGTYLEQFGWAYQAM